MSIDEVLARTLLLAMQQSAQPDPVYRPTITDNAKKFLIDYCRSVGVPDQREITDSLLFAANFALQESTVPTLEDIAAAFCETRFCACLFDTPFHECVAACTHLLKNMVHAALDCGIIIGLCQYYRYENTYPDLVALSDFLRNSHHVQSDPDDYCNNKKHCIPTPGLEHIVSYKSTTNNDGCSICLEDIATGVDIFKLPQCGHIFHADEKQCLGEGSSVLTWLQKSRNCPNCNTEITIDNKTSKRKHNGEEEKKSDRYTPAVEEDAEVTTLVLDST
jgi:hypothetical protein